MDLALCLYRYQPFGGLERNFRAVAEILLERGHRVRALARSFEGELPAGLEACPTETGGWTNPGRDLRFARGVERALARRPADLVLGFNRLPGLDLFYAADPCFLSTLEGRGPWARWSRRGRLRAGLERAIFGAGSRTEALVLTPGERDAYERHYGTPRSRLHVLPPSLEPRFLEPPPDRDGSRRELDLDDTDAVLLHLGSDFRRKGLDRTVTALAGLPEPLRSQTRLLVAGRGRRGAIERQARRAGIGEAVRFFGPVEDPRPLFAAADLLVHPAREENTGGVLLEALGQGVPVVTTAVPGFAEHVARSGGGVVLPEPFLQESLTASLRELLGNAERRRACSAAGRQHVATTPVGGRAAAIADRVEALGRARGLH